MQLLEERYLAFSRMEKNGEDVRRWTSMVSIFPLSPFWRKTGVIYTWHPYIEYDTASFREAHRKMDAADRLIQQLLPKMTSVFSLFSARNVLEATASEGSAEKIVERTILPPKQAIGADKDFEGAKLALQDGVKGYARDVLETTRRLREARVHSARVAIMSRNMSHNIGSHVLSRLGRGEDGGQAKWFTARYLQQRMDFLAQVATEWPRTIEPAWLLQDLVRWFLTQEDILNNIAASEGFEAFYFDGGTGHRRRKIRLFVFAVPMPADGTDVWEPAEPAASVGARIAQLRQHCQSYRGRANQLGCQHKNNDMAAAAAPECYRMLLNSGAERQEGILRVENDVLVGIPGGIVGWQAFYVILENVIRNAAKHHSGEGNGDAPLDIVIEVLHDPAHTLFVRCGTGESTERLPAILLRIYDNLSTLDDKVCLWGNADKPGLNDMLNQPLITETGELRKGHWGLVEMRIAAGFLQRRSIHEEADQTKGITGPPSGGENPESAGFLAWAKGGEGSPFTIRAIRSPLNTLGYEFYMLRPREVVILALPEARAADGAGGTSQ
jgi:hypothetical protein